MGRSGAKASRAKARCLLFSCQPGPPQPDCRLVGVRGGFMVPIHGMDLRCRVPAGLSLFTIGLNFQKVKCLFLTERSTWFLLTLPIRDSQLCSRGLGSEYLPIIGYANRYLKCDPKRRSNG